MQAQCFIQSLLLIFCLFTVCYFYLPTTEQTSLTIEERSVPAYYSRMALSRKIDCVWDIHHNGTNERVRKEICMSFSLEGT